jgi:hypothetical protein
MGDGSDTAYLAGVAISAIGFFCADTEGVKHQNLSLVIMRLLHAMAPSYLYTNAAIII